MTLKLAVRIEGDATALRAATEDAKRQLQGVGAAAAQTSEQVDRATRPRAPDGRFLPAGAPASGGPAGPAPSAPPRSAPNVIPFPAGQAASGLRSDQWSNLSFQANDAVTMLASGSGLMQVLATQAGQVVQVLQDGPGGVAGSLKEIGSRALGLLTPFRLMAGGIAGVTAAAVALGLSWRSSQEEIERGLLGIGRLSGATAVDINRIADAAPAGISRGTARGIAGEMASTGRIDVGNIPGVLGLVPGFARLTGQSQGAAGSDLARLFADPIKGAGELDAKLGSLDDRTQRLIRSLVAQGRSQEAIQVMVRAFGPDLERIAEKTSLWGRAWNAVAGAADRAGEAVNRALTGGSAEDRIAAATQRLERARAAAAGSGNPNPVDQSEVEFYRRQGMSDAQIRALTSPQQPGSAPGARARADREEQSASDDLENEREARRRSGQSQFRSTREADLRDWSKKAGEAIRGLSPEIQVLEDLRAKIALLENMNPEGLAKLGVTADQAKDALAAAQGAVNSFMSAEEKARASSALTVRSIEARTVAEKAAIAAERERIALAGQAISDDDRRKRIEEARAAVLAQSTRDAADRYRSANDSASNAGLLPYERQIAQLEQRYRDIFQADAGNPDAMAKNRAAKAADRSAIDTEAMGGPLRDANRALEEQAAALRVQQASLGASTEEAGRLAAAQQLLNRYIAAGVPVTAEMRQGIDAYAAAAGKMAVAEEDLQRRRSRVVGTLDDGRSTTRGLLTGTFSDLRQGRNVGAGIANQLGGAADRLFERFAAAPIAEGLLGADGKGGGGILGGTLAAILGGGKSAVSTATISASTVIVTGSIASGPLGDVLAKAGIGAGAGSGRAGFDLLGARSAGTAAPVASGLNAFGLGGPTIGGGGGNVAPGVVGGVQLSSLPPQAKALLDAIASTESGGRYNVRYTPGGGATFGDLSRHPMIREAGPHGSSDAAGRYQFLSSTFRRVAPGADFSPQSQDAAAWRLAQQDYTARTGRDLSAELERGGLTPEITRTLRPTWLGLGNTSRSIATYNRSLTRYGTGADSAAAAAGPAVDAAPIAAVAQPLQEVSAAAQTSAQSVSSLAGGLTNLPGPLSQLTQGLSQLGNSLVSSFQGAFSTAGAAAIPSNADGGLFRGRGTGRSDSNLSWISDGEFIVNAASTARALPLLQAINDNRLPAFAEGGLAGPATARRGPNGERPSPGGAAPDGLRIENHVHNNAGVEVRQETKPDGRGGLRIDTHLDRAIAGALNRPGSQTEKALRGGYGARRGLAAR